MVLIGALAPGLFAGCKTRSESASPDGVRQDAGPAKAPGDLIAIDVLLEPDQAGITRGRAVNARLRENLPAGYQLDSTHAPHVTLIQRFVRARDLDSVHAAVSRALAAERPTEWPLRMTGYGYVTWGGHALTFLNIEPTADLVRLQQKVVDAVAPYAVNGGTAAAFAGADPANRETVANVEGFVPNGTGANFQPHLTVGIADSSFVERLKAERFAALTFRAVGVANYQLGNYGVAAKLLWRAPAPAAH